MAYQGRKKGKGRRTNKKQSWRKKICLHAIVTVPEPKPGKLLIQPSLWNVSLLLEMHFPEGCICAARHAPQEHLLLKADPSPCELVGESPAHPAPNFIQLSSGASHSWQYHQFTHGVIDNLLGQGTAYLCVPQAQVPGGLGVLLPGGMAVPKSVLEEGFIPCCGSSRAVSLFLGRNGRGQWPVRLWRRGGWEKGLSCWAVFHADRGDLWAARK